MTPHVGSLCAPDVIPVDAVIPGCPPSPRFSKMR